MRLTPNSQFFAPLLPHLFIIAIIKHRIGIFVFVTVIVLVSVFLCSLLHNLYLSFHPFLLRNLRAISSPVYDQSEPRLISRDPYSPFSYSVLCFLLCLFFSALCCWGSMLCHSWSQINQKEEYHHLSLILT